MRGALGCNVLCAIISTHRAEEEFALISTICWVFCSSCPVFLVWVLEATSPPVRIDLPFCSVTSLKGLQYPTAVP